MLEGLKLYLKNLFRDAFVEGVREGVEIMTAKVAPSIASQPLEIDDKPSRNGRKQKVETD